MLLQMSMREDVTANRSNGDIDQVAVDGGEQLGSVLFSWRNRRSVTSAEVGREPTMALACTQDALSSKFRTRREYSSVRRRCFLSYMLSLRTHLVDKN